MACAGRPLSVATTDRCTWLWHSGMQRAAAEADEFRIEYPIRNDGLIGLLTHSAWTSGVARVGRGGVGENLLKVSPQPARPIRLCYGGNAGRKRRTLISS